jgi:hypothetical protein
MKKMWNTPLINKIFKFQKFKIINMRKILKANIFKKFINHNLRMKRIFMKNKHKKKKVNFK